MSLDVEMNIHIRNQRSDNPIRTVETAFRSIQKFVNYLVVNNNRYLLYTVDSIIFGISLPDYPSRIVESNSPRSFCSFSIFCLLNILINNTKSACYRFKTAKFRFSIFDTF